MNIDIVHLISYRVNAYIQKTCIFTTEESISIEDTHILNEFNDLLINGLYYWIDKDKKEIVVFRSSYAKRIEKIGIVSYQDKSSFNVLYEFVDMLMNDQS